MPLLNRTYALTYLGEVPDLKHNRVPETENSETMNSSDGVAIRRTVSGYVIIANPSFNLERKFGRALRQIIDADGLQAIDGLVLSHIAQGDEWVRPADGNCKHVDYLTSDTHKFNSAKHNIRLIERLKSPQAVHATP